MGGRDSVVPKVLSIIVEAASLALDAIPDADHETAASALCEIVTQAVRLADDLGLDLAGQFKAIKGPDGYPAG
jgi:hypothetical protein